MFRKIGNFLKSNKCMVLLCLFLMLFNVADAYAQVDSVQDKLHDGTRAASFNLNSTSAIFNVAAAKLINLFKNSKMIIFIIGGFGLIALAFQAIFGKVRWGWFSALAFGLAVVAAAGYVINYAADAAVLGGAGGGTTNLEDTYGSFAVVGGGAGAPTGGVSP
ncbi:MAG: hypothetical protein IJ778_03455 [Alphaproteobacteria bacterium]|nr:hypothetical protein [Alphaproteobacteria bacterium]